MKGVVCGQALASNKMDFAAPPTALYMILRGMPYRIVFVSADRYGHFFMVGPNIRSFADLRGKMLAIDGPGGAIDSMTRTILQMNGLNPDKDVTYIAIGQEEGSGIGDSGWIDCRWSYSPQWTPFD